MKFASFIAMFLIPLVFAFTSPEASEMTCPTPTNVQQTAKTSSSISFSWNSTSSNFIVKYYRHDDQYESAEISVSGTSYTFSNLSSGTYDFYFATECSSEEVSDYVVEDIVDL